MSLAEVTFPGGKKVDVDIKGLKVKTDQPKLSGGDGTAPSPFDLFFASIASCSGFYALSFCQSKGIETEGLKVSLDVDKDEEKGLISKINIEVTLPEQFPDKYKDAILRSIDLCTVKKNILNAPDFNLELK
ncbi:OsmC family protein [Gottschalkia acidurici 9a]|uniref:OsmC family protein n=1 Tax=Gottschalkia acidurici (strain ATCC 7906 / DSM 604 / BCRC 14475 / CIP 104303 / KCTC 5404 / NCIMB 10678 / 9a) TaxID=1128398 RepID=K0B5A7_GOTA9|nr:OsmC family protein [Gottschalkia acidurici]AFS79726.1 OsmC family protein [Gottschalkia acidurici 9a]